MTRPSRRASARHDPARHGEEFGHVVRDDRRQRDGSAIARGEAPLDLAHREASVRRCYPDVGTQHDLGATAQAVAMDRGDDRHRHLAPSPRRLLAEMGEPVTRVGYAGHLVDRSLVTAGRDEQPAVQPGAESPSDTGEHDDSGRAVRLDRLACLDDPLVHGEVQRVQLVRSVQTDLDDAAVTRHENTIRHLGA
jgi:hypothetical protein